MILSNPRKLVVIGNGMAGARAVEEILRRNRRCFKITMIGAEPHGNYNRILLSNVLNGSQDPSEIFLNTLPWYAENKIDLRAGRKAVKIDRAEQQVLLDDGTTVEYDTLILATGSRPFVPPMPGTDLKGVFVFRTLEDCAAITKWAKHCKTAAVIGGGLLGLEAAKGLMTHGPAVHVIEVNPHLMSVQLDSTGGAILGKSIAEMGVTAHHSMPTAGIVGVDGCVRAIAFKDGTELPCEMVVISAGIRANIEVARDAGLPVERGVLVNDQLLTVDPSIYAVGECAQHDGRVYGLVAPIWEQCVVLADHLTGVNADAAYRGSILATQLKVMGVNVASMGERDEKPDDEVVRFENRSAGIYKKLIIRAGKLVGALLVGEVDSYASLLDKLKTHAELPKRRSELLFAPAAVGDSEIGFASLPDDKQICDCNGVSKGRIVAAIGDGHCTVSAVGKCTRAGTGCGSCKGIIKGIIEAVAGEVKADPSENWYVPAVPMDKPALIREVRARGLKSVSAVLRELGTGEDEKSKMGLASLLRSLWNRDYIDERDSRYINDRVHANIQKDGTFSVIPRMFGGVTSADELIRIGEVAKKYSVPMVKLTGGQRIDLLGVKKEDLPKVWKELGAPSGHAYTKAFRTCKTCVGTEFCRFGTNDSTALGIAIEKRFQGIEFPAKLKMAVSGCPRNCAESTVKDIGIVASEGGEWEIVIGGAAGASVRKADVLCRVRTQEEALTIVGRFMQYYREHAKWLERTYDFVPRVGLERLRAILIDDSEGLAAALDAAIQETVDAFVDPWLERDQPAYVSQFDAPRQIALPVLNG